jgi:hypothetical protein
VNVEAAVPQRTGASEWEPHGILDRLNIVGPGRWERRLWVLQADVLPGKPLRPENGQRLRLQGRHYLKVASKVTQVPTYLTLRTSVSSKKWLPCCLSVTKAGFSCLDRRPPALSSQLIHNDNLFHSATSRAKMRQAGGITTHCRT